MILVFGKTGQVAIELQRLGGVIALGRDAVDLSDPGSCAAAIHEYAPFAVINAAAYTAVDRAEEDEAVATIINGYAPAAMANACAELSVPFVHISTDYVFDGTGMDAWFPTSKTNPQTAYGRSKLAGEIGVRASGAVHAIIRTSWAISSHGSNFVKSMLTLSEYHPSLKIVADQVGGPTPAHDIAVACMQIVEQLMNDPSKSGTYHLSGAPDLSWAEFAQIIFAQADRSVTVIPIPSREYPTLAKRPLNSRMDCSSTEDTFDISRPDWRLGLSRILYELEVTS